jgi:uncharacterized protein
MHGSFTVTLHLTGNCTLRCSYCYGGEKRGRGMTVETADAAVEFALREARRREARHLEVILFGGEPLLRLDLVRRIVHAARQGAEGMRTSFKLSTNGTLLDEATMAELSRLEVYVSISVDGEPPVQDEQRPDAAGKGSSTRVARAIDVLLRFNPCANATCVITPRSAGRADRSVRWLFDRGFNYVTTTLDYGGLWDGRGFEALRGSYRRLAKWYEKETRAGRKFYLSCFDERIATHAQGPAAPAERCSFGTSEISIAPSGRIFPCVQFVGDDTLTDYTIGDIRGGFDEERRASLAEAATREKPECEGCALAPRCSVWCACVNYRTTGCVDRASPVLCEHERLLMPIVDRVARRLWKSRVPEFVHKQYNDAYPVISFLEHDLEQNPR